MWERQVLHYSQAFYALLQECRAIPERTVESAGNLSANGGKVPEILPQQAHKWRNETKWDEVNLLEPQIRREALEDADQDDEYIVIKTPI